MAKGHLNSGYFQAVPHPGGIAGNPAACSPDMMDETDKVMGEGHIQGSARDAMGSDAKATTVVGSAQSGSRGAKSSITAGGGSGSADPQVKGLGAKGRRGSQLPAGNPGAKVGKPSMPVRAGNSAPSVKGLNATPRRGSQTSAGNPGAKVGKGK